MRKKTIKITLAVIFAFLLILFLSSLGLHGESLGAASSITSLEYSPEVDFTNEKVQEIRHKTKMADTSEVSAIFFTILCG